MQNFFLKDSLKTTLKCRDIFKGPLKLEVVCTGRDFWRVLKHSPLVFVLSLQAAFDRLLARLFFLTGSLVQKKTIQRLELNYFCFKVAPPTHAELNWWVGLIARKNFGGNGR